MSKSAAKRISGCVGVLAGVLCAGAALAAPTASPPNFSSNASVSWLAVSAGFKPPANGAGPLKDDPAHPTVTNDDFRIRDLKQHLHELRGALDDGVDVRGFFYWSLLDNFEWQFGYSKKFGLLSVDFNDEKLPRKMTRVGEFYRGICSR